MKRSRSESDTKKQARDYLRKVEKRRMSPTKHK